MLEKWNFTEVVFKTTTKQGTVRGAAFSVLPLALKMSFSHWHQLFFPQREVRTIWEAEILSIQVTFMLRTLQKSWLKDTNTGNQLQAIHSCAPDNYVGSFELKTNNGSHQICNLFNPTRANSDFLWTRTKLMPQSILTLLHFNNFISGFQLHL